MTLKLAITIFVLILLISLGFFSCKSTHKSYSEHLFYITCAVMPESDKTCFSREKRMEQILKSIVSVRKMVPDSFVVLLEIGSASEDERRYLDSLVDLYMSIPVSGLSKSLGEATMMNEFFLSQWFMQNKHRFKTFSKLSGRYFLTDKYDFSRHSHEKNIIKFRWVHPGEGVFETRHFRIPSSNIDKFIKNLENVVNVHPYIFKHIDIEHIFFLFDFFPSCETIHAKKIDVAGWYTGNGDYVED